VSETVRSRSAALDAVRVAGIAVVVASHTWPDAPLLRLLASPWHVPAFFILTGYLWNEHRTLGDDARRRAHSLLLPYATWLALIGLPFVVWTWVQGGSPARMAAGLLYGAQLGRPFSAFWFVAALFAACLLVRLMQRFTRPVAWLAAGAGVVAVYLAGPTLADTPYSIGLVPACAAFILLGQEIRRVRHLVQRPGVIGVIALTTALVLIAGGAYAPLDIKYGDLGLPLIGVVVATLVSTGLILVAEATVPRLSARLQETISHAAGAGLAVLLGHAAVLYLGDSLAQGPPVLVFLLALLLPWGVGLVALRTRLSPWLTGTRSRPASTRPQHPAPSGAPVRELSLVGAGTGRR
jgi:acyltransferase